MSESASEASPAGGARPSSGASRGAQPRRNIFARIALFVRQVVAELKKVVTPSRAELIKYTTVVLVFVAVVMAFVTLVDFVIGQGTFWLFG
ncbi:MAG: preprotein translocase subunit SecE [Cellulomonadaceae bacterium]